MKIPLNCTVNKPVRRAYAAMSPHLAAKPQEKIFWAATKPTIKLKNKFYNRLSQINRN